MAMVCDICGLPEEGRVISSDQMRTAVFGNGFNPFSLKLTPNVSGASTEVLYAEWKRTVSKDTTGWNICSLCITALQRYLNDKSKSAGGTRSEAGSASEETAYTTGTFYGKTQEDAQEAARKGSVGKRIKDQKVTRPVERRTIEAGGATPEQAMKELKSKLPPDAFEISSAKVLNKSETGIMEIQAQSKADAKLQWTRKKPQDADLVSLDCKIEPKSGFLGFGKKLGCWEAKWSKLCRAQIAFNLPAEVTVRYFTTAATAASAAAEATIVSSGHYVLKCLRCGFTHHIPKEYQDNDTNYSVDTQLARLTCLYAGRFTVSLAVNEFFAIMPTPSSNEILEASIGGNMRKLHDHILSHCDPLFLIIRQSPSKTEHVYRSKPEGETYVRFSKAGGVDIVGNINIGKAEIPGVS
jgi:hypothetical protein